VGPLPLGRFGTVTMSAQSLTREGLENNYQFEIGEEHYYHIDGLLLRTDAALGVWPLILWHIARARIHRLRIVSDKRTVDGQQRDTGLRGCADWKRFTNTIKDLETVYACDV